VGARGRARPQDRAACVTLTGARALGSGEEIKLHVRGALTLGHAPDDVVELFIHLIRTSACRAWSRDALRG
jgi:alkylhydroperoxidase/carboxymuconolactone decarboxylase family protein YurZ